MTARVELGFAQGSAEWQTARLGIPTSSQFGRIVTPTGKLSTQRLGYIGELLAEWALGEPYADFEDEWMERGRLLEPQARKAFAFEADADVRTVGFVYRDAERTVGCSPDGMIGEHATLELKCPKASTHLVWLAQGDIPRQHIPQVQGAIWVCGSTHAYFMSFHPNLPSLVKRIDPDPAYQAALDEHMPEFIGELKEGRERLLEMGVEPVMDDSVHRAREVEAPVNHRLSMQFHRPL